MDACNLQASFSILLVSQTPTDENQRLAEMRWLYPRAQARLARLLCKELSA
jgi:hypothetical protein